MEKPKRDKRKHGEYRPIVRIIGWTLIIGWPLLWLLWINFWIIFA